MGNKIFVDVVKSPVRSGSAGVRSNLLLGGFFDPIGPGFWPLEGYLDPFSEISFRVRHVFEFFDNTPHPGDIFNYHVEPRIPVFEVFGGSVDVLKVRKEFVFGRLGSCRGNR